MRPDVVVGAGGYVSVPVVVAALAQRIPVVLLEQNAVPGRATRMLARRARVVAASFAETAAHLPHARVVHTGNPIRAEVRAVTSAPGRGSAPRDPGHRRVAGRAAGSIARSPAAWSSCSAGDPELRIVHQCGSLDYEAVQRAAEALPAATSPRVIPRSPSSTTWPGRIGLRATSWSCVRADRRSPSARRWAGR